MKKSLKLLLLFLILGLSFILTACEKEYITYALSEDGSSYFVTGYVGDSKKIVIPSKYKKLPVTGISDSAFSGCESLTSIEIPKSVKSIGEYGFLVCKNLKSIVIPESVTSIKETAFLGCSNLRKIVVNENNKVYDSRNNCNAIIETKTNTLIVGCSGTQIPDSVTSIGKDAFYESGNFEYNIYDNAKYFGNKDNPYFLLVDTIDNNITSCEINENTKIIGCEAFFSCYKLTSIKIPEGVITIELRAFMDCWNLSSIEIPESIRGIGGAAFFGCVKLKGIEIPEGIINIGTSAFSSTDLTYNIYNNGKYLGNKDNPYLVLVSAINENITSCEINSNTKIICAYAFKGCKNLTSIKILENVKSIGYHPFKECDSLTIYCEVLEKPDSWVNDWNPDNRPVVWDYKEN